MVKRYEFPMQPGSWLLISLNSLGAVILVEKSDFQMGKKLNDESSVLVRYYVKSEPE